MEPTQDDSDALVAHALDIVARAIAAEPTQAMHETGRDIASRFRNGHSDFLAEAIAVAIAEAVAAEREACAKWHDDQAALCRQIAKTIRAEWMGLDIPAEDRRANVEDAREHDELAGLHSRFAAAIRARSVPTAAP